MYSIINAITSKSGYFKNLPVKYVNIFPDHIKPSYKPTDQQLKILKNIKPKPLKDFKGKEEKQKAREAKELYNKLRKFLPGKKRKRKTLGKTIEKDIETVEKDIKIIESAQQEEKEAIKEIRKGRGIRKRAKRQLTGYQLFIKEDMAKNKKENKKLSLSSSAKKWKSLSKEEKEKYKSRASTMKPKEKVEKKKVEKKEVAPKKKVEKKKVEKKKVEPKKKVEKKEEGGTGFGTKKDIKQWKEEERLNKLEDEKKWKERQQEKKKEKEEEEDKKITNKRLATKIFNMAKSKFDKDLDHDVIKKTIIYFDTVDKFNKAQTSFKRRELKNKFKSLQEGITNQLLDDGLSKKNINKYFKEAEKYY
jgi:hypothetical protein